MPKFLPPSKIPDLRKKCEFIILTNSSNTGLGTFSVCFSKSPGKRCRLLKAILGAQYLVPEIFLMFLKAKH